MGLHYESFLNDNKDILDTIKEMQKFANSLGREKIVSITELRYCRHKVGDDGYYECTVWYWE